MFNEKYETLLLSTLAADSYCLGTHWIYDLEELQGLQIDWEILNAPHVSWHEGKVKGDLTHYGDQLIILDQFLKDKKTFDVQAYMLHWHNEMQTFKGYKDAAIKDTMINMDNKLNIPCGSNSGDMSVIGRIVPLLKVSQTKDEFLENTALLVQATHNNEQVVEAMHFFSMLLLETLEGNTIQSAILKLRSKYSDEIQNYIDLGMASKDTDTALAIASFGSACPTEFSFPSTIHLLFKYDNYKEALIQNSKSGGDSAARAMVIAYLFAAQGSIDIVPKAWLAFNAKDSRL